MKSIIQFQITENDDGFLAEGVNASIVTQADTLDELTTNIREAVSLYLENENSAELGLAPTPSVLLNFELPVVAYA